MRRTFTSALLSTFLTTLALPSLALAHGGLPIAQDIVFQGDTLVVPTRFWGVFLGNDGGPWRWICEEAINKQQARKWALAKDGTFHVTDYAGITSSRDGGCTWIQSTGEIQQRVTSSIVADPVEGKRAWATTEEGPGAAAPWNALFRTDDDGVTWTSALQGDEYFRGVALSPSGQRVYTTGVPRTNGSPPTTLHVSSDGGMTWSASPIAWQQCDTAMPPNCFNPLRVVPIAVDPNDLDTVYLRVESNPTAILLAAHPDGTAKELLRADGYKSGDGTLLQPGIGTVEFLADKTMLVATQQGLYRALGGLAAGGTLTKISRLAQTQCARAHEGKLYACAWNYAPDNAAIASAPLGGATTPAGPSFAKLFQYADTCGPVTTCAPSTPVAMTCPAIWQMYADQLGASTDNCAAAPDGGTAMNGTGGCHCDVARRSDNSPIAAMLLSMVVALGGAAWRRRWRVRLGEGEEE